MSPAVVVVAHAVATVFMAGLSWTIHVVHYPLFARVGDGFDAYEREHTRRVTALLAVPWTAEGLTALALPFVSRRPAVVVPALLGLALLAAVVAVTVLAAVPAHARLSAGFDPAAHRSLMRADRVRVACWTARAVLAVALLAVVR